STARTTGKARFSPSVPATRDGPVSSCPSPSALLSSILAPSRQTPASAGIASPPPLQQPSSGCTGRSIEKGRSCTPQRRIRVVEVGETITPPPPPPPPPL
ncbi:unnamed protein product, partial [Cochlearia groenlandica]